MKRRTGHAVRAGDMKKKAQPERLTVMRDLPDAGPAGVHRTPSTLLNDAIERALGWRSEDKMRDLVERFTGYTMTLTEANLFSQDVAQLVIRELRRVP